MKRNPIVIKAKWGSSMADARLVEIPGFQLSEYFGYYRGEDYGRCGFVLIHLPTGFGAGSYKRIKNAREAARILTKYVNPKVDISSSDLNIHNAYWTEKIQLKIKQLSKR